MLAVEYLKVVLDEVYPGLAWDGGDSKRTAERFVSYLLEYAPSDVCPFEATVFEHHGDQLVMAGPTFYSSICQHHLLPYYGQAWVGYVSNGLVIGASKMPRLVAWAAARPSTQEQMAVFISKQLNRWLKPKGAMVVLSAVHTCMTCRGVRCEGTKLTTSLPTGLFLSEGSAKDEFLLFVHDKGE